MWECFDTVSDFILQQAFKQHPLVKFWYSIKKNTHNFLKRLYSVSPFSDHISAWGQVFFIHSTEATYHNRMNGEAAENLAVVY